MTDADLDALIDTGFRYALALTHARELAEDLLQDAWERMLKGGYAPSRPLLIRTIRNRWIDGWRRRQRVPLVALPAPEQIPGSGRGPDHPMDQASAVEDLLGSLSSDAREVLFLHAVLGHSASEIAALTERPRGTILSILHRAKQRVRADREAM